jgi:hypothetical protein
MSKRKRTGGNTSAGESTEVGMLLSELFDPGYQVLAKMKVSESDILQFLEASRQLFKYKPNRFSQPPALRQLSSLKP